MEVSFAIFTHAIRVNEHVTFVQIGEGNDAVLVFDNVKCQFNEI